jgi:hypothetical protein
VLLVAFERGHERGEAVQVALYTRVNTLHIRKHPSKRLEYLLVPIHFHSRPSQPHLFASLPLQGNKGKFKKKKIKIHSPFKQKARRNQYPSLSLVWLEEAAIVSAGGVELRPRDPRRDLVQVSKEMKAEEIKRQEKKKTRAATDPATRRQKEVN